MPPGVIIDRSPAPSRVYIDSPSIAVLPSGDYVASHEFFGPGTINSRAAVFASKDRGATWQKVATLDDQLWSTCHLTLPEPNWRYFHVEYRTDDCAGFAGLPSSDVTLAQGGGAAKQQHAVIGVAQQQTPRRTFPKTPPNDGFPRRAWACSFIGEFLRGWQP